LKISVYANATAAVAVEKKKYKNEVLPKPQA